MNYGELKTAILGDTHRADYTAHVARFVQQGEALIRASLEGYLLTSVITEADRIDEGLYSLPAIRVTLMRHVIYNNAPLRQVDESLIYQYRELTDVCAYCMRDLQIVFAGVPPEDAEFTTLFYGMPAALAADGDTNNLLNDYPQLYNEAAQVYVYKRARDLEGASAAFQSVQSLIRDINRSTKKKLGGAQSANPYNVSFRSEY